MTESDHPNPSPQAGDFTFSKGAVPTLHSKFQSKYRNTCRTDSSFGNPYQQTEPANSAAKT